jgi:hypothetical protein
MHLGLDFDLKDKVPLDIEETFQAIVSLSQDKHMPVEQAQESEKIF